MRTLTGFILKNLLKIPAFFCFIFLGLVLFPGCASKPPQPDQTARIYLESPDDGKQFNRPARQIVMPITENQYYVYSKPILTEADIANIELVKVDLGLCIRIDFSRRAGVVLQQTTVSNQGGRLFLLVDDKPVGVRLIDGPIVGGMLYMFLELPEDQITDFVMNLRESCMKFQKERKAKGY